MELFGLKCGDFLWGHPDPLERPPKVSRNITLLATEKGVHCPPSLSFAVTI